MGKAKVGIQDKTRRERVGAAECRAVGVAMPVARIAAPADRRALHHGAESGRREVSVMEKTEAPEHIHLVVYVPIDLAIDGVPVKGEAAGGKIVVLHARQVRLGEQTVDLLSNLSTRCIQ